jgi:hypothetical protein
MKYVHERTAINSRDTGVDPDVNVKNWPGGCAQTAFAFHVPTLRLETIIEMLPFHTVDFLKIDAQVRVR